jgi:hypothetical protein
MEEVRKVCDATEKQVPAELWTLVRLVVRVRGEIMGSIIIIRTDCDSPTFL